MIPSGILAAICLGVSLTLVSRKHPAGWPGLVLTALLILAAVLLRPDATPREASVEPTTIPAKLPEVASTYGYVSSATCRQCHPGEHASWSGSYHSTMTQRVSTETIAAPAEETRLELHGRVFRFIPESDRFLVETVDPEWDHERRKAGLRMISENENPPMVHRQVVMSTGSHHYQTYWINGRKGNQLWRAPWVYHIERKRWLPLLDTFIIPPNNLFNVTSWNNNCIHCHSTGGEPGLEAPDSPATTVGDLSISCEACHGPGQKHVEHQRTLRASGRFPTGSDPTIVNPARLPPHRSSEVCGQCHSMSSFDGTHRRPFQPGEPLADAVTLLRYTDEVVQNSGNNRDSFWNDGTMRVAGRDFTALSESACYLNGEISCLSCHSMHGYQSRDDQLAAEMRSDLACLQCHEDFEKNISAHTHHAVDSVGSRCMNCHMPHTSFGLMKAIRSHRIDSPTSAMTLRYGRPNACLLCHADRTMPWLDARLVEWYGHEPAQTSDIASETSSALAFLISGDAVQRAVVAWNMGREESQRACGMEWQVPLLAQLLDDPYSVVRATAEKSLRKFPSVGSFEYDFLAEDADRKAVKELLIRRWKERQQSQGMTGQLSKRKPAELIPLFLTPDGDIDTTRLNRLRQLRDDRPVHLVE